LRMRKTFDSAFKAKVALEALQENKTLTELGQKYDVHPNQITQWQKQLSEQASGIFEKVGKVNKEEKDALEKEERFLRMSVENEFLKKKYRELYGHEPKL